MILTDRPEIELNKTTEELKAQRHKDCDFCRCKALRQPRGATGVPPVA